MAFLITRLIPTETPLAGIGPALFGEDTNVIDFGMALLLIPGAALAHWIPLRPRFPMLLAHVVFVLDLFAFSFLLAPIEGVLSLLFDTRPVLATLASVLAPLALIVYWLLALSRLTGETFRGALRLGIAIYGALLLVGLPVFLIQMLFES